MYSAEPLPHFVDEYLAWLEARLDDFAPGDRVRLDLLRDGKRASIDITLTASR